MVLIARSLNGAVSSARELPKKEAYAVLARFALQLGAVRWSAIHLKTVGCFRMTDRGGTTVAAY